MNGFRKGDVPDKSAEVQECEGEVPRILAASEGNEWVCTPAAPAPPSFESLAPSPLPWVLTHLAKGDLRWGTSMDKVDNDHSI